MGRQTMLFVAATVAVMLVGTTASALAQDGAALQGQLEGALRVVQGAQLPESVAITPGWWWVAPIASVVALICAWIFYKSVMRADEGNDRMKEIAGYVRDGAMAYLGRQYRVVSLVFLVLLVILAALAIIGIQNPFVPIAFLTGGFFSGLCGYFGMRTATNASARTAQGASESLNNGLQVAFRSGAVMGFT